MGLAEKGVQYTLQPAAPHTPEVNALHPFGRIPVLADGPISVFETSAILRYVEEAFPGPSLVPGSIRERARGEQWVSALNAYVDGPLVRRYVLPYVGLFPEGKALIANYPNLARGHAPIAERASFRDTMPPMGG